MAASSLYSPSPDSFIPHPFPPRSQLPFKDVMELDAKEPNKRFVKKHPHRLKYNPFSQGVLEPTLLSIFSNPRAQGPLGKVNASISLMRSLLKGQSRSQHPP